MFFYKEFSKKTPTKTNLTIRRVANYWDRLPANFHVFGTFRSTKDNSLSTDYYSRHSGHTHKAMFPHLNSTQCPWGDRLCKALSEGLDVYFFLLMFYLVLVV